MYETSEEPGQIERTARDPRFQSGMIELINEVYETDAKIDI
jgi:hypothetical protein